jgi:glycosyltransferase involved in cell wall biosynthesis
LSGIKYVLDIRTIPVELHDCIDRLKEKFFYVAIAFAKKLASGITVITSCMQDELLPPTSIPHMNIGIWTSGVSLDAFRPENFRESRDSRNDFMIMYHGIFTKTRGLYETIDAMELVRDQTPNVKLMLVGDGPSASELREMVRQKHLENTVFFHEKVLYQRIPEILAKCDVGILPFPDSIWWRVSSPLKLMEYLAMEKPVIVTDIVAHRSVIKESPCGIYIRSNRPEDIVGGILKAYTKRGQMATFGKFGRDIIERNYTWEIQAQRLVEYFKSL